MDFSILGPRPSPVCILTLKQRLHPKKESHWTCKASRTLLQRLRLETTLASCEIAERFHSRQYFPWASARRYRRAWFRVRFQKNRMNHQKVFTVEKDGKKRTDRLHIRQMQRRTCTHRFPDPAHSQR